MIGLIVVFVRTLLLYAVIIISLRMLGKRQIGEMEPSELVVAVLISDMAAIPIQNNSIPLAVGLIPVLTLIALELILSQATVQNARIRAVLCGVPSIIIQDGMPVQSAMRKNRISIDELMEMLRRDGITDIADVRCAVLETDGNISIIPWADRQPVTASQLGIAAQDSGLFTILINDGRVISRNLAFRGLDEKWLYSRLCSLGAEKPEDVFMLSVNDALEIRFAAKEKG